MNKQIDDIQEQINRIANDLNGHCCDLSGMFCGEVSCNACLTEYLFHAGYRRQEDVAREIFTEIENSISPMLGLEDDKEYVAILATTFAELKKKYGVKE